jgi:hypothetical protein
MSENLTPKKLELLADMQKDSIRLIKEGKMTDEYKHLHEQLILNMSDPRQEWGRNNLRDIILMFHASGHSAEMIYNILYTMGIEKQTAYDGIQAYLPKKNTDTPMSTIAIVNVKEQINISGKIHSLIEKMNAYNSGDSLNYTVKTIVGICESYLKNDLSGLSAYDHAQLAKGLVRELNQYNHIKPVSEAIKTLEDSLAENSMGLQLDGLYSKLANANNNSYTTVIGKLTELKGLNESEIREKSKGELINFNYIPDVRLFLESVDLSKDAVAVTVSPVDGFNLKSRLRDLHENINKYEAPNSTYTVNTIKAICEKYINQLYNGNLSVSESQVASNVANDLQSFMWLDMVKESITDMAKYINENIMCFEVNEALRKLRNNNGNAFYNSAVAGLESLRNLTESEVREKIKYNLNSFTWIPEIKRLIESVNYLENALSSNADAIVEKVYSPMMNIDGKNAFYLSRKIYTIDESKQLIEVNPNLATALYLTLIAVSENFKFNENKMTYYKGNTVVEFELTGNGTAFKFNGKDIAIKESNDIRNFLLSNGSYGVNDGEELDMVVKAYENMSSFIELDFVQSIKSRQHAGITVNVIRVDENVYINRVNPYMNTNETIKASTATDAIGLVKEYVNFDIKLSVVDLLEEEAQQLVIKEAKKEAIFDKIAFLKEQRSVLSTQDKSIQYIKEADDLIASEIQRFEKELNELVK